MMSSLSKNTVKQCIPGRIELSTGFKYFYSLQSSVTSGIGYYELAKLNYVVVLKPMLYFI